MSMGTTSLLHNELKLAGVLAVICLKKTHKSSCGIKLKCSLNSNYSRHSMYLQRYTIVNKNFHIP